MDPKSLPVFGPDPEQNHVPTIFWPLGGSRTEPTMVGAAVAQDGPKRQSQRAADRIIREFLKQIKAQDIRIRRIGHTTYSWKHPIDPEPSDTGSDVRWEIKLSASQIHMGVYDIKPFYRVVGGPFTVEKLTQVRKNILDEMAADAEE